MTFEKWFEMAILYGSDPDNENQVAIGSRLRITVNTVNFAYFVFSRLSPFSYSRVFRLFRILAPFAFFVFSYSRSYSRAFEASLTVAFFWIEANAIQRIRPRACTGHVASTVPLRVATMTSCSLTHGQG